MVKGAIVVILDEHDRVLLLYRPKAARWAPHKWGYPGGKIEKGEAPMQAAIRETKEETSLDVRNLKDINLGVDIQVRAYYTRDYDGNVSIDYEHEDWAWVHPDVVDKYDLAPNVAELLEWVLENE